MDKLLLISYYGLQDALKSVANALQKFYIVIDFPLFKYAFDKFEKRSDYIELLKDFIYQEQPDIILWWFINIPALEILKIRNSYPNILSVYYNWDDPWLWKGTFTNDNSKLELKCKAFDLVFASSEDKLDTYIEYGSKYSFFLPPAYDPNVYHTITNHDSNDIDKYSCDISFCCTNLYEDTNIYDQQLIPRKQIVDLLATSDINFHLYGPEFLRNKYPNNYKGYAKYHDVNKIINYSKISLCCHVTNAKKYINERTVLVLGAGGLLFVDKIKELDAILTDNENCIFIGDNMIDQIKNILNNYDDYKKIRTNASVFAERFTWDQWALVINNQINIYKQKNPQQVNVLQSIQGQVQPRHVPQLIHQTIDTKLNSNIKLHNPVIRASLFNKFSKIYYSSSDHDISKNLLKILNVCNENPDIDINEYLTSFF